MVTETRPASDVVVALSTPDDWDDWRCQQQGGLAAGDGGGWQLDGSGVLSATGLPGYGNLFTAREFTDFELSLDYRLTAGANSGILFRATGSGGMWGDQSLEIQLQDDDGWRPNKPGVVLKPEQRNGSMYGMAAPWKPAGKTVGQWNSLVLKSVDSQVTVTLNGSQIIDLDLLTSPETQPFLNEKPALRRRSGRIGLQKHTGNVSFRNIRIRELTAAKFTGATDEAKVVTPPTSARDLFNGKDLSGWYARNEDPTGTRSYGRWSADEGRQAITCTGTGRDYLVSDESFDEYVFELEWRFKPGGPSTPNGSGVVIHSTGNPFEDNPKGYEIDLRKPPTSGGQPVASGRIRAGTGAVICYGVTAANHTGPAEGTRGSVRGLGLLRSPKINESGGWNRLRIATFDDRFLVWINDDLVNEVWNLSETFGRICLRSQKTAVEFRRVSIRSVPEGDERVELQLDGKWRAVRQEVGGNQWTYQKLFGHEKSIRFRDDEFTINYLSQTSGQPVVENGRSSINGNNIDLLLSGGKTGLEFQGVYELKNGILRHCFVKSDTGKGRPQSVVTQAGMPQFGTTYIRWRSDERMPSIHPSRFVGRWTQTPTSGNSANQAHRVYDLLSDGSMLHTNLVTGEQVVGRWYYEDNAVWLDNDQGSKQYEIQSTSADVIQVRAEGIRPYRWDRQDD
jgi:uncharacterized protein (TIGR03067 family)